MRLRIILIGVFFALMFRYGALPDGQRFLINIPVETQSSSAITVVLNWTADLKR